MESHRRGAVEDGNLALAGRHVGHDDGGFPAFHGEQICRVVGKVRNTVFRDDAHDLSLCIVGGGLPHHAAQEGRIIFLVPKNFHIHDENAQGHDQYPIWSTIFPELIYIC